ncbi:replication protein P [Volucribacter amazonae]|uniref:Phage replication protein P n=1 Tax=Volucribacter amazonae TaxID=256731 RepID=A0A9X4PBW7_9PAST|nr:replication protein P [Volucribacter amazonae]MDG6894546.1 hypothetical protein [Volucribacter amazonae]
MKSVAQLINQPLIGREASYSPSEPIKQPIEPKIAMFVDRLFLRLKAIFPAWRNAFDSEQTYEEAKVYWLEALVNNGITTAEQFKRGLAQAELSTSPFLPSVGQFISWCQDEDYHALGLPNEAELAGRIQQFMGYARYEEHAFRYRSPAEYWLLSTYYRHNWNKPEDVKEMAMRKLLAEAVEKVKAGFNFPAIPLAIEDKSLSLDITDVTTRGMEKIRKVLRSNNDRI